MILCCGLLKDLCSLSPVSSSSAHMGMGFMKSGWMEIKWEWNLEQQSLHPRSRKQDQDPCPDPVLNQRLPLAEYSHCGEALGMGRLPSRRAGVDPAQSPSC